jgi:virginiamycin A acetyltransferase
MLKILKKILYVLIWLLLIPFFIWERLPFSEYSTFTAISQLLATVPGVFGIYLRRVWYRQTLKKCGDNITVDWMAVLRTRDAVVGNRCTFGVYSWVGLAQVGDDVMTGSHVVITSGSNQHSYIRRDLPMRAQQGIKKMVVIGDDVWIGTNAIVMKDVSQGTVVGAGSIITKTFPPFQVIAGNPASVIKAR